MSVLSELSWHAGWIDNLEVDLWQAMERGSCRYGQADLTSEQLDELRRLADSCGGWIVFDPTIEEIFVTFAEWDRIRSLGTIVEPPL